MQHGPQRSPFPATSAETAGASKIHPAGLIRVFHPDSLDLDDLTHAISCLLSENQARPGPALNLSEIDLPSRAHRGTYVMEARTPR